MKINAFTSPVPPDSGRSQAKRQVSGPVAETDKFSGPHLGSLQEKLATQTELGIREDFVAAVQGELKAGSYLSEARLLKAADRLAQRL